MKIPILIVCSVVLLVLVDVNDAVKLPKTFSKTPKKPRGQVASRPLGSRNTLPEVHERLDTHLDLLQSITPIPSSSTVKEPESEEVEVEYVDDVKPTKKPANTREYEDDDSEEENRTSKPHVPIHFDPEKFVLPPIDPGRITIGPIPNPKYFIKLRNQFYEPLSVSMKTLGSINSAIGDDLKDINRSICEDYFEQIREAQEDLNYVKREIEAKSSLISETKHEQQRFLTEVDLIEDVLIRMRSLNVVKAFELASTNIDKINKQCSYKLFQFAGNVSQDLYRKNWLKACDDLPDIGQQIASVIGNETEAMSKCTSDGLEHVKRLLDGSRKLLTNVMNNVTTLHFTVNDCLSKDCALTWRRSTANLETARTAFEKDRLVLKIRKLNRLQTRTSICLLEVTDRIDDYTDYYMAEAVECIIS